MSKLDHLHDPDSIRERLLSQNKSNYLRDFIYGSIDGTVTTFAIVAGVVGAGLSDKTIIILGFANVFADGFSMAASNYLGTKAESDEIRKIYSHELYQIRNGPEGELEEIRQIFKSKGFKGDELEKIVEVISQNEKEWLKIMLQEEYGIGTQTRNALISGLTTFLSFIAFGILPLIPFILGGNLNFFYASLTAGIYFFFIGAFKSKWSLESYLESGFKTLLLGTIASFISFYTGRFLEKII